MHQHLLRQSAERFDQLCIVSSDWPFFLQLFWLDLKIILLMDCCCCVKNNILMKIPTSLCPWLDINYRLKTF